MLVYFTDLCRYLPTLTIFLFGIMHGLLPLDYFRYMVTCKSSKSRTYLDLGAWRSLDWDRKDISYGYT